MLFAGFCGTGFPVLFAVFPDYLFFRLVRRAFIAFVYRQKTGDKESDNAFGKVDLNNLIEEGEIVEEGNEEIHEIKLFRNALDFPKSN